MIQLISYLGLFTNSLIRCLENILESIFYLPLLDTHLGNIIFSLILLMLAINLLRKWVNGSYDNSHSDNKKEGDKKWLS